MDHGDEKLKTREELIAAVKYHFAFQMQTDKAELIGRFLSCKKDEKGGEMSRFRPAPRRAQRTTNNRQVDYNGGSRNSGQGGTSVKKSNAASSHATTTAHTSAGKTTQMQS